MLNRRLLRIKVMQSLYALKQSEMANYHNAFAYIEECFLPDLNSMEQQDPKKLGDQKKKATRHFEKYFKEESYTSFEKEEEPIKNSVREAIDQYYKQVEKDKKHFGKLLGKEVDGIYDSYILALSLLVELSDYVVVDEEEQKSKAKKGAASSTQVKFKDNQVIQLIKNNKEFNSNTSKGKLVWDREVVRKVYKLLKTDDYFLKYADSKTKDLEADKDIVLHILKNVVFKDALILGIFEERELNWSENKSIVRNMVVKTIKSVENTEEEIKLLALSANWEEDKLFFEELYQNTVEKDKEIEKIASEKIKNWDIERLAAIDRIILIMAISEMIHFSSIPVKVSINEYIELSKLYSTPKSKQFVNGILDKLAEDLIKKGLIKKSGRGLIDNK